MEELIKEVVDSRNGRITIEKDLTFDECLKISFRFPADNPQWSGNQVCPMTEIREGFGPLLIDEMCNRMVNDIRIKAGPVTTG